MSPYFWSVAIPMAALVLTIAAILLNVHIQTVRRRRARRAEWAARQPFLERERQRREAQYEREMAEFQSKIESLRVRPTQEGETDR